MPGRRRQPGQVRLRRYLVTETESGQRLEGEPVDDTEVAEWWLRPVNRSSQPIRHRRPRPMATTGSGRNPASGGSLLVLPR